jgi:hypothetical protein
MVALVLVPGRGRHSKVPFVSQVRRTLQRTLRALTADNTLPETAVEWESGRVRIDPNGLHAMFAQWAAARELLLQLEPNSVKMDRARVR